jgi:hypothetical protein
MRDLIYIYNACFYPICRTFTTKHVNQFPTTDVVISDTPAGYNFTEVYPQLDWCLWIYSVFIYPCTHGKSIFYTFLYSGCILLSSYWWHTLIINILNVLCVHVVDVHDVFI